MPVPNKDINDLNGLTGILKTVKDIYNSKSFDSTISAKLSGGDLSKDIDASIRLSGNFNADPYIAQVETISSNMLKGKALVTYSNGRTYVSVNDKIKGYIDCRDRKLFQYRYSIGQCFVIDRIEIICVIDSSFITRNI